VEVATRPKPFPIEPGQESVWDYPRPPALLATPKHLTVRVGDRTLADTTAGYRVLETSHPPVYYFPPDDIDWSLLTETSRTTFCEWKGTAVYVDVRVADRVIPEAGWRYLSPTPDFAAIAGYVAFYAGRVDECRVADEVVTPQPGGFYGGWITHDVVGPFKGEPNSWGW
jgi:uncharacterized protein (DUF427 family)